MVTRELHRELDAISVDELRRIGSAKWSAYPDCIGAWVAEMDFGTSPNVTAALKAAVNDAQFGYLTDALRRGLAEALAAWYQKTSGWTVPADRIHPMPDVIKVLEVMMPEFTRPGSKVIVPTPAYMPFLTVPPLYGREVIEVPMFRTESGWEFDYDGIDAAFAAGGSLLIVCNPFNPIGRVLRRDELVRLSQVVERHDGRVFADEIHAPITFPGHPHVPYASVSDAAARQAITAISASKAWNLPGLKCAQIVLTNDEDVLAWERIGVLASHSTSTLGVIANTAAYTCGSEWLAGIMAYLDGNRKLLAEMTGRLLPEVVHTPPEGTYLAWLDFRPLNLAADLDVFFRENAQVALVDGGACGEAGRGHVRLNFAMSRPLLEQTVERIAVAARAA